jgi:ankyrin repeat protein
VECLKYLIEYKAEIDKRDEFVFPCSNLRTPLYMACISGHGSAVQELIDNGADVSIPDRHYWFPVHRAALWSHISILRMLIKAGADVNAEDEVVHDLVMELLLILLETLALGCKMGSFRSGRASSQCRC